MKEFGIYIHYPFCANKCLYCDFLSFSKDDVGGHDYIKLQDEYMKKVIDELVDYSIKYKYKMLKSIFIGGGTPSLVSISNIEKMMKIISENFNIKEDCEITIESNPESVTKEKLKAYINSGINRISFGLQSTSNDILKVIGRVHTYERFEYVYKEARKAGFKNINVDLMFNLPNQSIEDINDTLMKLVNLNPEHISLYSLKIEEGTPFDKMLDLGEISISDDFDDREYYHNILRKLKQHDYNQYEISNVSKEGYNSIHNEIYWKNQEYIGVGLGSHSKSYTEKMIRYGNTSDIDEYIESTNFDDIRVNLEEISKEEDLFETIILGLRLNEGLNIKTINNKYDINFEEKYLDKLKMLEEQKLIEVEVGKKIKLTVMGMDLSNKVFIEFMH